MVLKSLTLPPTIVGLQYFVTGTEWQQVGR